MADAFENILGQPQVRDFLRSHGGERPREPRVPVHRAGRFQQDAWPPMRFAQAHPLPEGRPAARAAATAAPATSAGASCASKHPDVRYVRSRRGGRLSGGAGPRHRDGHVAMAPIQADQARSTSSTGWTCWARPAANAFLKTLEEPPADVVLVLLGRTRRKRAAHHRSRAARWCRSATIPATRGGGHPQRRTREPRWRRRAWRHARPATGPSRAAVEFLKSNERLGVPRPGARGAGVACAVPTTGT